MCEREGGDRRRFISSKGKRGRRGGEKREREREREER
jgi:hypothetical protein